MSCRPGAIIAGTIATRRRSGWKPPAAPANSDHEGNWPRECKSHGSLNLESLLDDQSVRFFGALGFFLILLIMLALAFNSIERKAQRIHDEKRARAHHDEDAEYGIDEGRRVLAAHIHAITRQFNAYRHQQHHEDERRAFREKVTIAVIAITAAFALGSNIFFALQWREMHQAGVDTGKLAEAARDQATSSRAHVWITSTDWPKRGTLHQYNMYTVTLHFINFGQTPAIIINLKIHMFICPWSFTPNSLDQRFVFCRESMSWPPDDLSEGTGITGSLHANIPPNSVRVIGTNQDVPVEKDFLFENSNNMDPALFEMGKTDWVYCVIKYKDVFGIDRETGYFAKVGGGIPAEAEKYNYWK
jgi:hypothetical protein